MLDEDEAVGRGGGKAGHLFQFNVAALAESAYAFGQLDGFHASVVSRPLRYTQESLSMGAVPEQALERLQSGALELQCCTS
jgi:hypothetical protein